MWALFDHVKHWFSSLPLNKVCYPWCELQLLFRSHSHANTLSYCSTLVKLVSWKWYFNWNQHLEANLVYVMNTKIVPFTILDVSKVFWWRHNHVMHWSHMITSIIKYMSNITCNKEKVDKMKLHMLMLMNAWMMLLLMKCKCQMQSLTLGCYMNILQVGSSYEGRQALFLIFLSNIPYV